MKPAPTDIACTERPGLWPRAVLRGTAPLALGALLASCGGGDTVGKPGALNVAFNDCAEYIGVTLVPSAGVARVVASNFVVAEDSPPTVAIENRKTFFVMRTATCNAVSVDGGASIPATLAQVGIAILQPVGNGASQGGYSYLATYITNDAELASRLAAFGLPVELDPTIAQTFTAAGSASGAYSASVASRILGSFTMAGSVTPPTANDPPIVVPFVADWLNSGSTNVKMRTTFPAIAIGAPAPGGPPTVTVSATPGSVLAGWLGAPGAAFYITSVYDTWAQATMTVDYSN